jgi:hypothetical protein
VLSQQRAGFRFSARIGERRDDTTNEGSIVFANVDLQADNASPLLALSKLR